MARTKYTEHFCGYCNKNTRMEIVGEMQEAEQKIWYRCTRCHHMSLINLKLETPTPNGKVDPALAKMYSPGLRFDVGDPIFHKEWNDVGRVLNRTRTSDGSESILVLFEREGERRLIQNLRLESSTIL